VRTRRSHPVRNPCDDDIRLYVTVVVATLVGALRSRASASYDLVRRGLFEYLVLVEEGAVFLLAALIEHTWRPGLRAPHIRTFSPRSAELRRVHDCFQKTNLWNQPPGGWLRTPDLNHARADMRHGQLMLCRPSAPRFRTRQHFRYFLRSCRQEHSLALTRQHTSHSGRVSTSVEVKAPISMQFRVVFSLALISFKLPPKGSERSCTQGREHL
jgi:hypothetical protein